MKPNLSEAFQLLSEPIQDIKTRAQALKLLPPIAQKLFNKWTCNNLVITLGDLGMAAFTKNSDLNNFHLSPSRASEAVEVSGAGDTALAFLALEYLEKNDLEVSVDLANTAAGIVVGKPGTAKPTYHELETAWKLNQTIAQTQTSSN